MYEFPGRGQAVLFSGLSNYFTFRIKTKLFYTPILFQLVKRMSSKNLPSMEAVE